MNMQSLNLKLVVGTTYLAFILIGLYFLFSVVDIRDLMSYEFIRMNKDIILKYKSENFLFLTIIFFIFSIVWVLFLGFVMPLLVFSGFVFGKWWGILIVLTSTTIGATLLYLLAGFFFREKIKEKLGGIREISIKFSGQDPAKDLLDIRPVCHYMMGGLHTDIDGATEIQGVWAAGEAACNSVHGSNRLGANSTSECIVWGKITGEQAVDYIQKNTQ